MPVKRQSIQSDISTESREETPVRDKPKDLTDKGDRRKPSTGFRQPEIRAQSPSDESEVLSASPTPDSESSREDEVRQSFLRLAIYKEEIRIRRKM